MFTLEELDNYVTHDQQVEDDSAGPVVLVNIFHVKPEEGDELIATWGDIVHQFKSSPELPGYPDGAVATPHLFRKAAIDNVCVE